MTSCRGPGMSVNRPHNALANWLTERPRVTPRADGSVTNEPGGQWRCELPRQLRRVARPLAGAARRTRRVRPWRRPTFETQTTDSHQQATGACPPHPADGLAGGKAPADATGGRWRDQRIWRPIAMRASATVAAYGSAVGWRNPSHPESSPVASVNVLVGRKGWARRTTLVPACRLPTWPRNSGAAMPPRARDDSRATSLPAGRQVARPTC